MNRILSKTSEPEIRVSVKSMIINGFLAAFKFIAGFFFNSTAMVSDAVHSLSDMFSTIFVIIGIKVSRKESDEKHPFGHDRFECIASILLGTLLGVTGICIAVSGINNIVNHESLEAPGLITLVAAIVSICVKEWMYRFTKKVAVKINSGLVMADAWHHRSDALSSVGALIGIAGARLGVRVLDPIASILICICILKATLDIFRDAVNKMLDVACDRDTEKKIEELCLKTEGVIDIKALKTRLFGSKIYVNVEVIADGEISLYESDIISGEIHDKIENNFPQVKHCFVIIRPQ